MENVIGHCVARNTIVYIQYTRHVPSNGKARTVLCQPGLTVCDFLLAHAIDVKWQAALRARSKGPQPDQSSGQGDGHGVDCSDGEALVSGEEFEAEVTSYMREIV